MEYKDDILDQAINDYKAKLVKLKKKIRAVIDTDVKDVDVLKEQLILKLLE